MKIQANGIRFNYELTGRKGASVVMLSHSLANSMAMWDPQLGALESRFQVLRYDMRGHGDSEAPDGAIGSKLARRAWGFGDRSFPFGSGIGHGHDSPQQRLGRKAPHRPERSFRLIPTGSSGPDCMFSHRGRL